MPRKNTSGFKGVSWDSARRKWRADLGGRALGRFDTPEAAHAAYVTAAEQLFGWVGGSAPPSAKQAAIAAGERHYFTGVPCRSGHVAKRFTSCGLCVACQREKVRKHRERNPEWWAEKQRRYIASDPERRREVERRSREKNGHKYVNRQRESNKAYREKHRERLLQSNKEWRAANPERVRASVKRWQAENPEKVRAANVAAKSRRRARQNAAEGRFTAADVRALETRQKGKCACCRQKRKLAVDHIVPLAKGGTNWPNNLQLLCKSCNSSKHAKDPISFMQEKGMLL
jgi:5-methylcytosine-specific restriction endonuclease McrA